MVGLVIPSAPDASPSFFPLYHFQDVLGGEVLVQRALCVLVMMSERLHEILSPPVASNSNSACSAGSLDNWQKGILNGGRVLGAVGASGRCEKILCDSRKVRHCETLAILQAC